ncbi:hypothetical protein KEM55_003711 [Ascosphaera atra]|nr:hypothetical protein KEM55_003711 [Ascosphaera atra]
MADEPQPRNSFEAERPSLKDILDESNEQGTSSGPVPPSAFPSTRKTNPHTSPREQQQEREREAREGPQGPMPPPDSAQGASAEKMARVRHYSSVLEDANSAMAEANTKAKRLAELEEKMHQDKVRMHHRRLSQLGDAAHDQARTEDDLRRKGSIS